MSSLPLLPYKFRFYGIFLLIIAVGCGYLYFFGGRPVFFTVPVFAVVTSYIETRTMVLAQTNILDEIAVVFFIISLVFFGFSKDKDESELTLGLRLKSLMFSVYISSAIWILLFFLIYGWAVFIVSSGIFMAFLLLNIILYNAFKLNHLNKIKTYQQIQKPSAMKTQTLLIVLLFTFQFLLNSSCNLLEDDDSLGGSQSPIGAVDNNFGISAVTGISNANAKVTKLDKDVSTITYTCTVDNPNWLSLAPYIPGTVVNGKNVTSTGKVILTSEGIMNVYDEGNLILVKYDAKVGDSWSLKRGSKTITRTVTKKSETDDYSWGWLLIKTITVEETGRDVPGVSKVIYETNHRFGLVGVTVFFEDGTSKKVGIFSDADNG